ncbi:glycosyltransferase [bacterium AH-315-P15]|nr:glycosyltransferase [bacterium AH-315-P15]
MKICQIVSHVDEEASGPSYSVPRLCQALASEYRGVTLATLRSRKPRAPIPGIEHLEFRAQRWPRKLGVSSDMKNWLAHQAGNYDIIHSHGLWMMPNVYPAKTCTAHKRPYIVSPRGTLGPEALEYSRVVKSIFWCAAQKSALRSATAFHATSVSECREIRDAGFRQPIAIIPNGIDVPEVAPDVVRGGKRTLLYLGRLHPKKGIDLLIRAWSKVEHRYPDWDLLIVGTGAASYIRTLHTLAQETDAKRVHFKDAIYGTEKWDELRAASLVVLPTRNENFGMVVAEALSQSTPVLTTTGAPWAGLERNDSGWWISPNCSALVSAFETILPLPEGRLREMGALGREWMLREFSWASIAEKMSEFYNWTSLGGDRPSCVSGGSQDGLA